MQSKKKLKKLLIGVTGGIGSGKSLVCEYFKKSGGEVFFADKITRDLYVTNKKLLNELVKEFGKNILSEDRKLDILKFREIVYKSDANQKRVNNIVHPFAINEILRRTRNSESSLVFIEAALIFESGFDKYLDYTIEVFANVKTRMERVRKRNKLALRLIRTIIKMQMPEKEKLKMADFVIKNNSSKINLRKEAIFLYGILNRI